MKTPYPGLDYSGPGSTANRDAATGIRYGVISCNSVGQSLYDAQEMDYGKPHCPECGGEAESYDGAKHEDYGHEEHECADYACDSCESVFGSESAFPEEACGWSIDDGEYTIINCLDNDAMIVKSPYYTYAQFCSPCVPGAGSLDSPYTVEMDELKGPFLPETMKVLAESAGFPRVYCLGWDWFDEDNPCPYPAIYRVDNNEPVLPISPLTE